MAFKNNEMVYVTSVPLEKGKKRHIISCNGVNCEVDEIDVRYGADRLEIAYQYSVTIRVRKSDGCVYVGNDYTHLADVTKLVHMAAVIVEHEKNQAGVQCK